MKKRKVVNFEHLFKFFSNIEIIQIKMKYYLNAFIYVLSVGFIMLNLTLPKGRNYFVH